MKLIPWEPDLRTLVERIDRDDIDLQPEFQRQEVWSPAKKRRLIDTVLRNWSIPPVHLVEVETGRLEVLDGQQRLAAIRDFIHNEFSIDGHITPGDSKLISLNGLFYSKLGTVDRRNVDNYTLRCFRITDYAPEEPSELFYRLNQPTMLTAGEQRNALYGPARQQLKTLVSEFEAKGNNRSTIGFSNARLAYDDVLARLLFFIEANSIAIKGTEARISERFRLQKPFDTNVYDRALKAIISFSDERSSSDFMRFNKASLISWLIFLSRFENGQLKPGFMSAFSMATERKFTAHFVTEAAAAFHDRASLRVTDVSSVVYRDVALFYIYYFIHQDTLPPQIDAAVLRSIDDALKQRDKLSYEEALARIINVDSWGASL